MSILYYPDSVVKKLTSPVESLQKRNTLLSISGHANLISGFTYTLAPLADCEIQEIQLDFGSTASKNYSISKAIGRGVVAGVNDKLWFQADGAVAQPVIIPAGFYDGTALATAIQTALNDVDEFSAIAPIAVTYTVSTGLFAITPTTGTIQFYATAPGVPGVRCHSTAGPLIGFTANKAAASSLSSDVAVGGLTAVNPLVSLSANTDVHVISTDLLILDVDQSLQISVSAVATTLDYKIVYQLL